MTLDELRAERFVGHWFIHHACRFRFVGCDPTALMDLHDQCFDLATVAIPVLTAKDFDVDVAKNLTKEFDALAAKTYSPGDAGKWMNAHQQFKQRGRFE